MTNDLKEPLASLVWQPIDTAPMMFVVILHHPYYSHGRVRQGFRWKGGTWKGVNAIGTEDVLPFEPTHWMPLPSPPEALP